MRVRLPDPALRADLRDFLHRWGCVTYEVIDGAIEVIVSDAPAERQGAGAASSISTSRPGERTIRASGWSRSTDPSGVAVCWNCDTSRSSGCGRACRCRVWSAAVLDGTSTDAESVFALIAEPVGCAVLHEAAHPMDQGCTAVAPLDYFEPTP